jgi:hypothetical protein
MRRARWWLLTVALLLLSIVLDLPAAHAQTAPTIQPTTLTVVAGETIRFTGGGFANGERVATWATAPDGSVYSGDYFYAARADGTAELTFNVPGEALGGRWGFTAYGDRSQTPAIANFDVQANQSADSAPRDTVAPAAGPPGTEFRFNVYGFRGDEAISYWITGPDGKVFDANPNKKKADKNGKASVQWTAPTSAPRGVWVITIQGIKSNRAKGVRFEVR